MGSHLSPELTGAARDHDNLTCKDKLEKHAIAASCPMTCSIAAFVEILYIAIFSLADNLTRSVSASSD